MAQGAGKLKTKAASGGRKKTGLTKKGKRDAPPKKLQHVRERATQKKLSSTIHNSIEKQMVNAASAGKLTIMRNKGGEVEKVDRSGKDKAPKNFNP